MTEVKLSGLIIAIYARYSSDRQRDASIEDQIRACRILVERCGGTVCDELVFSDRAVSGASLDRPGWRKLVRAIEARDIDVVVTEDMSRISRQMADSATVLSEFRFKGIRLLTCGGLDTADPNAKVMA